MAARWPLVTAWLLTSDPSRLPLLISSALPLRAAARSEQHDRLAQSRPPRSGGNEYQPSRTNLAIAMQSTRLSRTRTLAYLGIAFSLAAILICSAGEILVRLFVPQPDTLRWLAPSERVPSMINRISATPRSQVPRIRRNSRIECPHPVAATSLCPQPASEAVVPRARRPGQVDHELPSSALRSGLR